MVPLADWLAYHAANTPVRAALIARGRTWSYTDLDTAATVLALQLRKRGVRAGDCVATLLHNGPGAAVLPHALVRLGAILVPLNVRLSETEIAWQLTDSRASLLIADKATAALAERARFRIQQPVVVQIDNRRVRLADANPDNHNEQPDRVLHMTHDSSDVLAIIYTSGTTGQPKGAMLTFGNFWWSALGSALNMGTQSDDRWLACMPLFHIGGLSIIMRAAIYGITAAVHDGFDAAAVNQAIDDERVSIVSVVAVMLQRMLDERGNRLYPSSLRCVLLGGGPAPRPLLERCARLGIPVSQTYGLTETTSQLATLAPEDALRRLGSAGRPLYPNEIRILSGGQDARPHEPGEILVRGPVVMAGYAGRPDATAAAMVDGWLRTGDIGTLDTDGCLRVLDRRDDLIITGGENVYPAEVEAALMAHPSVAEVAVVGLADAEWNQRVVAVVRLDNRLDGDATAIQNELRSHCLTRLAGYKVPREIRITTAPLPRTASGKLQRATVRHELGSASTPTRAQ